MTEQEQIELCMALINDVNVTESQVSAYLAIAAARILNVLYPFGTTVTEVPSQYSMLQCELAVRMIARRGGEGEISHSENGISRTYSNTDDVDLLRTIVPFVGVTNV